MEKNSLQIVGGHWSVNQATNCVIESSQQGNNSHKVNYDVKKFSLKMFRSGLGLGCKRLETRMPGLGLGLGWDGLDYSTA